MQRNYQELAGLLFVGLLLLFSARFSAGLGLLGMMLVIASGIGLLVGILSQRRNARR